MATCQKIDVPNWAHLIKDLVDLHYQDKKIILVMDNLNTHKLGSLYNAFEPEEARRISETLPNGSWFDMAEIGVLSRFESTNPRPRNFMLRNRKMGNVIKKLFV
ncbi:MAG: transposase [Candidatus Marithrix sp.]